MPTTDKIKEVEFLSQVYTDNNVFYLTDYRGLTVVQMETLRSKLREHEALVRIAKNRLIRKAWEGSANEEVFEYLKEPTALIYTKEDPVMPARVLKDFLKDNEQLDIKAIVVDDMVYDSSKFESFATMSSPQEMKAKLVGALASPLNGIVGVLSALPRNLVYAINAIAEKKKEEAAN